MKTIWKILAWISVLCGLAAYFTGWIALAAKTAIWNIPTEFWFYDAVATGVFGLFFLIYGVHSGRKEK